MAFARAIEVELDCNLAHPVHMPAQVILLWAKISMTPIRDEKPLAPFQALENLVFVSCISQLVGIMARARRQGSGLIICEKRQVLL